jgi:PEP-CTERM motif/Dockerin type I domain
MELSGLGSTFSVTVPQQSMEVVILNPVLAGDMNRDGHITSADILPMMQALTSPQTYESTYGVNAADLQLIGDTSGDGTFTNADLQSLLNLLKSGGGSADSVPEPASIVLVGLGALAFAVRRRSR